MISVQEAKNSINTCEVNKVIIEIPLSQALHFVLAEEIVSSINMPPFRQSAMDGYGIADIEKTEFEVINEIKAGDSLRLDLLPYQAIKIFTGAKVPDSVKAIIQIENCKRDGNKLVLFSTAQINQNIRPIGEQIKKNEIALTKEVILNPEAIGFLASLGITSVKVFQKPSIGIIVTGNELAKPGESLNEGMVYESNGIMLQMALKNITSQNITYQVKDNLLQTANVIKHALEKHDIIIISGGISVGDYDFVLEGLQKNNVQIQFYKVNQKPGKPLLFGNKEKKHVFALPGNPAASLTCFYVYVLPLLKRITGNDKDIFNCQKAVIKHDFNVNNQRNQFLKAIFHNNNVEVLSHQNSSMLNSFAQANCLLYLEAGTYNIEQGDLVDIYHI